MSPTTVTVTAAVPKGQTKKCGVGVKCGATVTVGGDGLLRAA